MNRLAAFTCLAFRTANQEQPPAATPAAAKAWQVVQTHDLRNANVDGLSTVAKAPVMFASRTGTAGSGSSLDRSSHVEQHGELELSLLACKM